MPLIRVERLDESGKLRVSKPLWLAWLGEQMPTLQEVCQLYLRRFTVDHWYRFLRQRLHWTLPKLTTPKQCERWSDLMPIMFASSSPSRENCLAWGSVGDLRYHRTQLHYHKALLGTGYLDSKYAQGLKVHSGLTVSQQQDFSKTL